MRMNRRDFLSIAALAAAAPALAAAETGQGRMETLPSFGRTGVPETRVRVWVPPASAQAGGRYRTLYMLDGQYAFAGDSEGTNFAADRRVAALIAAGTIPPTLIVAIDNAGDDRFLQYMPQTIFDRSGPRVRAVVEGEIKRLNGKPLMSAPFIRFVEDRLKPEVDRRYPTSPDRLDTAIFGASMAGVMAGALFVEADRSFGRAACMSPNWAIYNKDMIDDPALPRTWASYFGELGPPRGRRLWLDHGTQMMDAGMVPHQRAIAQRLIQLGWTRGCNLQTRVFNAGHAFAETAVQMDDVLAWLLA